MATGYAKASYTEVIDLQTTNGYTSIIGLHTPVGRRPYNRLYGFFNQFRKYRYKGISSLVMVPAANLPVDPLGLTGVQGTTDLMDPRDALNPILFHGCHGEHLSTILDQIYNSAERVTGGGLNFSEDGENVSDSMRETLVGNSNIGDYYKCLTDTTWKKFGIQSGVKLKGLHPLVHKLAINAPIVPGLSNNENNAILDNNAGMFREYSANTTTSVVETDNNATSNAVGTDLFAPANVVGSVYENNNGVASSRAQYVQEFTNGMTRLGWLPTTKAAPNAAATNEYNRVQIATLPKLFMGVLILPPSYNVEQYFRCVIRHEFEFSQFTTSLGAMSDYNLNENSMEPLTGSTNYFNWIDYGNNKIAEGETIDMVNGKSDVISDGVA